MRESAIKNSPLPPSIEKAYHKKCIDLKHRIQEIEQSNADATKRVERLERANMKQRVNRAFLLDYLKNMQALKGYESEESETRPPTPQDPPPRMKRSYNRNRSSPTAEQLAIPPSPPSVGASGYPPPPPNNHPYPHLANSSFAPPQPHGPAIPPIRAPSSSGRHASGGAAGPTPPGGSEPPISGGSGSDPHAAYSPNANLPPQATQPWIHSLPNGTSVVLIAPGVPKPAPWLISHLDPRHHVRHDFEDWSLEEQEDFIFNKEYLPFDVRGNAVLTDYDDSIGKYRHIFPGDRAWWNPVVESVRTDSAQHRERISRKSDSGRRHTNYSSDHRPSSSHRDRDRQRMIEDRPPSSAHRSLEEAEAMHRSASHHDSGRDPSGSAQPPGPPPGNNGGGGGGFTAVNR